MVLQTLIYFIIKLTIMRSTIIKWAAGGTLLLIFLVQACTKEAPTLLTTRDDFNNSSLVRVFIATVNANRNYIYLDGKPLNGSALTSGGMFPAAGIYASNIPPGVNGFLVRDTLSTTTQLPLSFAENLQVNKNYTIFMYDTITTPKQKTVETRYVVPEDTSCRIRFANFIYNPSAVPAIDVFSFTRNTNIFTNVPVTGVTDFIAYPTNLAPDTLYIRETGTTTNIIKVTISSSTLNDKRSYTLVYRGSHRGTRLATLYTDR